MESVLIMKYEEGQNPRLMPIKAHEAMLNRCRLSDLCTLKLSRIYSISHEVHWMETSPYITTELPAGFQNSKLFSLFTNHMVAGYEVS